MDYATVKNYPEARFTATLTINTKIRLRHKDVKERSQIRIRKLEPNLHQNKRLRLITMVNRPHPMNMIPKSSKNRPRRPLRLSPVISSQIRPTSKNQIGIR